MLLRIIVGIFVVLHGLVHLLYFGQSRRLFELQPDMVWPDRSWAFSRLLGQGAARWLAAVSCVVAMVGFVAGGIAILAGSAWWQPVVVGSAIFSSAIFILCWDATFKKLADQGLIAILINGAVLVALLMFHWPDFGF